MEQTAFVTGADRGLGLGLCKGLVARGWRVFGGRFLADWPDFDAAAQASGGLLTGVPLDVSSVDSAYAAADAVRAQAGRVDLLINNAGIISNNTNERPISQHQDYAEMHRVFDVNTLGPLRVVEAFLPLVQASDFRRLAFVSSEAGSIERCQRKSWFGYTMSKAALNRAVKLMFNDLRPQGFTFRLYHPGWVRSYMSGKKNLQATLEPEEAAEYALAFFLGSLEDEDRLAMWDYEGKPWPW